MDELETGKKLFETKAYEEAIVVLSQFLSKNKNHADALYMRAICYRKTDCFDDSIADFTAILDRLPEEPSILCERGISYFHKKDIENSLKDMDKAVEVDPTNPYRYSSRAYIKATVDPESAIKDYKRAIELDPKDEIAYNNLGLLEENLGRIKHSRKYFKKSNQIIGYDPEKRKRLNENKVTEQTSVLRIMLNVFTSRTTRKEYFKYLKSFF